ncbi:hypothetical protein OCJ35_25130 [Pluralibacter gergoviae]|uniref:hypothetical protein n=1 Tax=Pluralibacter gergoviae TaxID=61647 RepID=UPI001FF5D6F1|nr:hypothetical protein [Pluralibacter gergoviae]MCK1068685.1 hypothetical protein [Pluralibacter gergoviae]MCV7761365.1 hypothetical protein [Pluralibacter gergoviae]HDS1115212.1 hypothetical protein [Pluralibacter gergoviae]HDS1238161.1 hypothetical protein [Pluralibacter gergoviae]HDS1239454.1 hypothetical protein [Pluralibacter gergoviae]
MVKDFSINPLSELRDKAKDYISVEDALHIISKKLDCSLTTAAEIILHKIPDDSDWNGDAINPSFFGKKLGTATFLHCDNRPLVRSMLMAIINDEATAFVKIEEPTDFDLDIPF